MKTLIFIILATVATISSAGSPGSCRLMTKDEAAKVLSETRSNGYPIERFYASVDGYIYELVNPNCPECIITDDIRVILHDWYIDLTTEYIFNGGFDHAN